MVVRLSWDAGWTDTRGHCELEEARYSLQVPVNVKVQECAPCTRAPKTRQNRPDDDKMQLFLQANFI
jgi:hypothetical protein